MIKPFLFLLAFVPQVCLAENLAKNSTMEPKAKGWEGQKNFIDFNGNSAMLLEARRNRPVEFYQDIDTRKKSKVHIKLRYRNKDYEGNGINILVTRSDGSQTHATFVLEKGSEWKEIEWPFPEFRNQKEIQFAFQLLEGKGMVAIDDVVLDVN